MNLARRFKRQLERNEAVDWLADDGMTTLDARRDAAIWATLHCAGYDCLRAPPGARSFEGAVRNLNCDHSIVLILDEVSVLPALRAGVERRQDDTQWLVVSLSGPPRARASGTDADIDCWREALQSPRVTILRPVPDAAESAAPGGVAAQELSDARAIAMNNGLLPVASA